VKGTDERRYYFFDDLTLPHQQDASADPLEFRQQVARHEDRHALLRELPQQLPQEENPRRIQSIRGIVQEQPPHPRASRRGCCR
jgi:hypothetical protein